MPATIKGEIHIQGIKQACSNATVYVRLLDVTFADAPSKVVAEQVIEKVSIVLQNQPDIAFFIHDVKLDLNASYILTVHIDANGNGVLDQGDYITQASYTVLPKCQEISLAVRVLPVS